MIRNEKSIWKNGSFIINIKNVYNYCFKQRINVPYGYEEKSIDEFHHALFAGLIMHDKWVNMCILQQTDKLCYRLLRY